MSELDVSVSLANSDVIREKATVERGHTCALLLGSQADNTIIYKTRIRCVWYSGHDIAVYGCFWVIFECHVWTLVHVHVHVYLHTCNR